MPELISNPQERPKNYPAFSMEQGLSLEQLPVAGAVFREIRKAIGYQDNPEQ